MAAERRDNKETWHIAGTRRLRERSDDRHGERREDRRIVEGGQTCQDGRQTESGGRTDM